MVGKGRKDIVDEGGVPQLLARSLGMFIVLGNGRSLVRSAAADHAMRRLEMLDGSLPHPSHRGRCRRGSFKPSVRGTCLFGYKKNTIISEPQKVRA